MRIDTRRWEVELRKRHPNEAEAAPALLKTAARLLAVATTNPPPKPPTKPSSLSERIKRALAVLAGKE